MVSLSCLGFTANWERLPYELRFPQKRSWGLRFLTYGVALMGNVSSVVSWSSMDEMSKNIFLWICRPLSNRIPTFTGNVGFSYSKVKKLQEFFLDIANLYVDNTLPRNLGTRLANEVASHPRKKRNTRSFLRIYQFDYAPFRTHQT